MPRSAKRRPCRNGRTAYKFDKSTTVQLEGFNLTNRKDSAIDDYYASKLQSEAASVNDIHFHPIEPRSFRVSVTRNFN